MKHLILFALIIFTFFSAFTQNAWKENWMKQDKALHLTYSSALTCLAIETSKDLKFKNPEVVGITAAISIGIAKEFLYDKWPDPYDLTADIVGCVAGVYLNRWLCKVETKWLNKTVNKKGR